MRRLGVILFVWVWMLVLCGTAAATTYTETKDLDITVTGTGSVSWTYSTPLDLSVPPDTVNSATLTIEAYGVNGSNDQIVVEGVFVGTLVNESWVWTVTWTTLDISSVFTSWTAGDTLNVTLNFTEIPQWLNYLYVDSATLTIDYTDGSTTTAAVPEPATMLLLGFGLAGVAYGRKMFRR